MISVAEASLDLDFVVDSSQDDGIVRRQIGVLSYIWECGELPVLVFFESSDSANALCDMITDEIPSSCHLFDLDCKNQTTGVNPDPLLDDIRCWIDSEVQRGFVPLVLVRNAQFAGIEFIQSMMSFSRAHQGSHYGAGVLILADSAPMNAYDSLGVKYVVKLSGARSTRPEKTIAKPAEARTMRASLESDGEPQDFVPDSNDIPLLTEKVSRSRTGLIGRRLVGSLGLALLSIAAYTYLDQFFNRESMKELSVSRVEFPSVAVTFPGRKEAVISTLMDTSPPSPVLDFDPGVFVPDASLSDLVVLFGYDFFGFDIHHQDSPVQVFDSVSTGATVVVTKKQHTEDRNDALQSVNGEHIFPGVDPEMYTVQLLAVYHKKNISDFLSEHSFANTKIHSYRRDDRTIYVLLWSTFKTKEDANSALRSANPGIEPESVWIRRVGDVRAAISG